MHPLNELNELSASDELTASASAAGVLAAVVTSTAAAAGNLLPEAGGIGGNPRVAEAIGLLSQGDPGAGDIGSTVAPTGGDQVGSHDSNAAGSLLDGERDLPQPAGIGDRTFYLAMTAGQAVPIGRSITRSVAPLVEAVGPRNRIECRSRCGIGGFCDPAHADGCGGVFCGNRYALL